MPPPPPAAKRAKPSPPPPPVKDGAIAKWTDLNLKPHLFDGLISLGFERPSAIQQRAILPIIKGRDVICQSQSGTGKTAVFCIAMLQILNDQQFACQGILLSPTRELAEQTAKVIASLSSFAKVNILLCIGGSASAKEMVAKAQTCQVLVGTPGRALELVRKCPKEITSHCGLLVLDEADEMISSGQAKLVGEMFAELNKGLQVVLVTATLSNSVMELSCKFLVDPVRVLVRRDEVNVRSILQFAKPVDDEEEKFPFLLQIYSQLSIAQTIVFCNHKSKVISVARKLKQAGFSLSVLHGEMEQVERETNMQAFRNGKSRVLVCTDILGRGIDVQQVTLVVNYDVPVSKESYVHRIGRSGRFGRRGIAVTLYLSDKETVQNIEKHYKIKIAPVNTIKDLLKATSV